MLFWDEAALNCAHTSSDLFKQSLKEIVHLKLKMLSFTHPKVVPNL